MNVVLKKKAQQLNTVNDFIRFAVKQFTGRVCFGHGTDNPWDEAVYLILHVLGLSPDVDHKVLKRKLQLEEKRAMLNIINARVKKRIPAAYLTRTAWFMGLPFYVDERVLIPRSPLAELIEKSFIPWVKPQKVARILDIGTGSGCIAISCAYAFPRAQIDAIDISQAALRVAAINCENHKFQKRIKLLKSDLFAKLQGETYDIIISNPPYVGKTEMKSLPKEYLHEPRLALLAGKGGDEIIARIITEAPKHLKPRGILVVEVGNSIALVLKKYKRLPFLWLEFERGDAEIFLITREQLLEMAKV